MKLVFLMNGMTGLTMLKIRRLGHYRLINGHHVHIDTILEQDDGDYYYHSNSCSVMWRKDGKVKRDDYDKFHSYDINEVIGQLPNFI
jgi:hypothetical protein